MTGMHRRQGADWRAAMSRPGQAAQRVQRETCDGCHKDLIPAGAAIPVKQYHAVGYVQAMHELCIACHTQMAEQEGKPDFARCATCHKERRGITDTRRLAQA